MSNVPPPPPPGPTPSQPSQPTGAVTPPPANVTPTPPTTARVAAVGPSNMKLFAAEAVGTFVLMMIGPGTAILALDAVGPAGVAFAFGFALLTMAYAIGPISGCHINPAVTLAFLVSKKVTIQKAIYYWVAQIVGAILGGLLLFIISDAGDNDKTGVFASNGWGDELGVPFGLGAAIVVEVFFTALLIFVVLITTRTGFPTGFDGIAVGFTLGMIHLATIPVDNTSVNPARSIGAALYAGWDHLAQIWVFIIFPLIGAVLGVLVWLLASDERLEDTMFGGQSTVIAARDKAAGVANQIDDRLQR